MTPRKMQYSRSKVYYSVILLFISDKKQYEYKHDSHTVGLHWRMHKAEALKTAKE